MASADATEVDVSEFLAHFGIKGMKWGFRKAEQKPASSDAKASLDVRERVKKDKIRTLSNHELQTAINRMNLEQSFKRLAVNEKSPIARFVSSTLLEIGKREAAGYASKKTAGFIAKKTAGTVIKKVATGGLA